MRTFFIFIKCELGHTYGVAEKLVEDFDVVPFVFSISGKYDLIAQYHLPGDHDIGRFINETVHKIPGIRDTETIICFNPFTADKGLGEDEQSPPD